MTELWTIVTAALVAGFLGSAHCLGMCGGLSGLFAARAAASSLRSDFPRAVAYNLGRVISYTLFGAALASIGGAFVNLIPSLAGPVRLISGALIILVGLQVAFRWRLLTAVEAYGAKLWSRIAPATHGLLPIRSTAGAFRLGLLWGLLPCGLVYSALLIAASMVDPLAGGAVMFAFGIGTTPAMLLTGLGAAKLSGFANRNRIAAGLLVVVLGIATAAMPLSSLIGDVDHSHHSGHH